MKGYRTILFNGIMLLVALLSTSGVISGDMIPDAGAVNTFLDHLDAIILFLAPLVNVGLRMVTTTPGGKKE